MPPARSPIPIDFVITELRPGGAERNLVALVTGLDRCEFSPRVFSLAPRPLAGQDQLVRQLEDAAIELNFIGVEKSRQFFSAVRRLHRSLKERPPALIQSFLFHANVVSAVAARGLDIPVVAGLRVAQRERLRGFVERRLSRHIDMFVCVSHGVAKVAEEHAGLPPEKIVVIPNGIDPQRFANVSPADLTQLGVAAGQKVVLCLGRLEHQKGVDVLLEAARDFLPQRDDVTLLVVGDGSQREILQRQAESLSLQGNVIFASWQADALPLVAAADVVAIPSRWEGLSNVLMEAISLSRPVAVTDVEGTRELLSAASEKWIAPVKDSAALAAIITQLLDEKSAAARIAEANRQHVLSDFTMQKTISAYASLYRSLISHAK